MFSFFDSMIDYIEMFFGLLVNFVKAILTAIPMIRMAGDLPVHMTAYIPPAFVGMAAMLCGCFFVKFLLGR